jgi:hypothetical protein
MTERCHLLAKALTAGGQRQIGQGPELCRIHRLSAINDESQHCKCT